jgi:heat shock protein HtpX
LAQVPKLYTFAACEKMNAYALGGPEGSTITLTEGLLRKMSLAEIAGILAHEVAHICSSDTWTMSFAGGLQQSIALVAPAAFGLTARRPYVGSLRPLEILLACAPALGQLLYLGLSRIRERDADAMALQLTDDPRALVTALAKMECYHSGSLAMPAAVSRKNTGHYLCSHPPTDDRIGMVLDLAA